METPLATIGSGSHTLTLTRPVNGSDHPGRLAVVMCAESLSATTVIDGVDLQKLGAYLHTLAQTWQGWKGPRKWQARAGGIEIAAVHHRHPLLRVLMSGDMDGSAWTASAIIEVRAGRQLALADRALRAYAEPDGAHGLTAEK